MRYFITFACYGAHLHGDETGSVDRFHNLPFDRVLEHRPTRVRFERTLMKQPPYLLDNVQRTAVLRALQETCEYRAWTLLAPHVRTNHLHVIVESDDRPERVMGDFKAYASRALNALRIDPPGRKRWAKHGSTRWLWSDEDVRSAIRYVADEQGEPMAVFVHSELV